MKSYKRTIFTISSLLTGILTILFYINPNIKNNFLYIEDDTTHYWLSGTFLILTVTLIAFEDYILFKRIRNIK